MCADNNVHLNYFVLITQVLKDQTSVFEYLATSQQIIANHFQMYAIQFYIFVCMFFYHWWQPLVNPFIYIEYDNQVVHYLTTKINVTLTKLAAELMFTLIAYTAQASFKNLLTDFYTLKKLMETNGCHGNIHF